VHAELTMGRGEATLIVPSHAGATFSISIIREQSPTSMNGTSLVRLVDAGLGDAGEIRVSADGSSAW
jgi:phosphotransferase system HPr-like phosphotransfer protein